MSTRRASHIALVLAGALTLACSVAEAEKKARDAADRAKEAGEDLAERAGDKTRELAGEAGDKARGWWDEEVPDSGELSERAVGIIREGAENSEGSVESWVAKGMQIAPVALDIGKTLHSAVDSDTIIEPIVQKVDDEEARAELDAKISDMPRVETIEGVSVGFKDMTQYDTGGRSSESSYLVLWRRGDRLIGFVYRSKKRIDIDTLVGEAPRLIKLAQGVL